LPPITTFLNRLLALTIDLQGVLFTAFEQLLNAKIEGAIAARLRCWPGDAAGRKASSSLTASRSTPIRDGSGDPAAHHYRAPAQSPVTLDEALDHLADPRRALVNERSGRAAVQIPAPSLMLDDGEIERRVRLIGDGAPSCFAEDDGREPLAGGGAGAFAAAWAAKWPSAGVRRQHDPYRRRLAAADLEAPAE